MNHKRTYIIQLIILHMKMILTFSIYDFISSEATVLQCDTGSPGMTKKLYLVLGTLEHKTIQVYFPNHGPSIHNIYGKN